MLPAVSRVKKGDFDFLKGIKRKSFSSSLFNLVLYETDFDPSRFAVVVSPKVFKKATQRNKVKRQAKAVILKNIKFFKKGFAAVFYLKKSRDEVSFREIEDELLFLFKKSKILNV